MSEDKRPLRERLEDEIGSCQASDLSAHIERGVVVIVAADLKMVDAAVAVAEDDAESVQYWIEKGKFVKPTQSQIDAWKASPEAPFRSVIVRPYVLIQPLDVN